MLSANELDLRLKELSEKAIPGALEGTQVIVFKDDIASKAREQTNDRPYLIGLVPPADIEGRADGYTYANTLELFVGIKINARGSLETLASDMTKCADAITAIVRYIQERSLEDRFWARVSLSGAHIEPVVVQQMRGLVVILKVKTSL